jgi:hypothetical protein
MLSHFPSIAQASMQRCRPGRVCKFIQRQIIIYDDDDDFAKGKEV